MKPILTIYEQVDPAPPPYNRFRVLETTMTIDGSRTRVCERGYATFAEAEFETNRLRGYDFASRASDKLTIIVDGPQGSGVTRIANYLRELASQSVIGIVDLIVDMSELRDGKPHVNDGSKQAFAVNVGNGQSDHEIAIGEHAFKAGFRSAEKRARNFHPTRLDFNDAAAEKAWSEYTPPEELTGGGK